MSVRDNEGDTLVHVCARLGLSDVLHVLFDYVLLNHMENQLELDATNNAGFTPLQVEVFLPSVVSLFSFFFLFSLLPVCPLFSFALCLHLLLGWGAVTL